MTEATTFRVPDMTCGHCVATLRSALAEGLPGAEVTIDLPARTVRVAGDPAAAAAIIAAADYTPERLG